MGGLLHRLVLSLRPLLALGLLLALGGCAAPAPPGARGPVVAILCYHDLSDDPKAKTQTVSPEFLRRQIKACKAAGWTFVPLSRLIAAREHPETLPAKALVLTFDDGYRSFVELALPILRAEGVPATLSIVTSFVDRPPTDLSPLMSWDEIRTAVAGGVEIASHSHDLHRYETSNPYRDTAPSVATRRYLLAEARYENRDEYRARIEADLRASQSVLTERLGAAAPVLVWPYGAHNTMARTIAAAAGFGVSLGLDWRPVEAADLAAGCFPRIMVTRHFRFENDDWLHPPRRAMRVARVDLDEVYHPDPKFLADRVDRVVEKARAMGATHVFLQACTDSLAPRVPGWAWFTNHQARVRADVWSMVAQRMKHAGMKVWVRAPVLALPWVAEQKPEWRLARDGGAGAAPRRSRLSPNLPEAHRAAIDFYTDLAVYLGVDGVLFDADAAVFRDERLSGSLSADPAAKAEALEALLRDARDAVRTWRPECRFGRSIYAPVVEHEGVEPAFAQDLARSLLEEDLVVVMAHAESAGQRNAPAWIRALAKKAAHRAAERANAAPVLFELEARDREGGWVPAAKLEEEMKAARGAGIEHFGIYPIAPFGGEAPKSWGEARP